MFSGTDGIINSTYKDLLETKTQWTFISLIWVRGLQPFTYKSSTAQCNAFHYSSTHPFIYSDPSIYYPIIWSSFHRPLRFSFFVIYTLHLESKKWSSACRIHWECCFIYCHSCYNTPASRWKLYADLDIFLCSFFHCHTWSITWTNRLFHFYANGPGSYLYRCGRVARGCMEYTKLS